MTTRDLLLRLGRGDSIDSVCAVAGLTPAQFSAWWREQCRSRVPAASGNRPVPGLADRVRIQRDRWGVPHVFAAGTVDLFFGFGYAVAQDRLFQLDFLRRKARGRLAEIIGHDGIESDLLYRTLGLGQIADREWHTLPPRIQDLLAGYTAGINAVIEDSGSCCPIEFDLLDYRPEAWTATDSLAILGEFRWYLTGRFPVIAIPELARRRLGEGALYRAFLQGEENAESILLAGEYPARRHGIETSGAGGDSCGSGSNNWVIAGSRTASGKPLLASDPHIPFGAVSLWHEVHLHGDDFQVAGVAQAGMPAIMIGRSPHVAWGITNNICSQRDLYQEKTDPEHPGCYLYDGRWEPARERAEMIVVRGGAPVRHVVRASRNGPLVDALLPSAARASGPVSLRWLGFEPCGWLTAMIDMNGARCCAEFREAARPWLVPTFNVVFADTQGHIGMQSVGRIPVRAQEERGYRPGWDPAHQWTGLIPFEGMPHLADPPRGFIITANNRVAPDDFPYPLTGRWSMGYRARRIRSQIEPHARMTPEDSQRLQLDTYSGRAARCVPRLVALLANATEPRLGQAAQVLRDWDGYVEPTSVAAAIFNVFWAHWCRLVACARFPGDEAAFVAANIGGLAADLLDEDRCGWFAADDRQEKVRLALLRALEELAQRCGPEMSLWTWGRLHVLVQKHFLSGRGELGKLLDRSGLPARGDGTTVNSSTSDPNHAATLGAGFRMVADLADLGHGFWAVEVAGTSGHPGSPHYDDQIEPWSAGQYHYLSVTASEAGDEILVLAPPTS